MTAPLTSLDELYHAVRVATRTPADWVLMVDGISVHIYGTDLRRTGSSVRRTYDLPIIDRGGLTHSPH